MRCILAFFVLLAFLALTSAGCFAHGQCNDRARQSLRITFHDAIGYSTSLWTSKKYGGGGADGSLIQFAETELATPANKGLRGIVNDLKHIADSHNVSYGDIIQFAGAVGTSNCPGAPRLAFFAGRPQATAPSPADLFAAPMDSAERILSRMKDAGFSPAETVVLLGAHSVGVQRTINPAVSGKPLDTTPSVFDSQFYLEMLLKGTVYPRKAPHPGEALSASNGVFRFSSDAAIARHPSTACMWQSYIGQDNSLRAAFRRAMKKVSVLGQNPDDLLDCSEVIPVPPPSNASTRYPAGFKPADIEHSCRDVALPQLPHS
ncbi:manganese peroxidase isozyme precursor [Earliella scabrosa]|nr:manganese peroxidase isozyme precursor [Earliella scabrosa]